ncbi:DUF535 family protein [Asticcacaulis benevestitus]|uniref:DUF535 family protein n=1 Tax=Asticcacaulis benevestitus TaxID=347481 RepID=UPI00039A1453|nr:DUF535 family protein [Asticcacaulis benevestitus]
MDTGVKHLKRQDLFDSTARRELVERASRAITLARHVLPYMSFYRKFLASGYGQVVPRDQGLYNRKFLTPYLATFLTTAERLIIQGNLCDVLDRTFTSQNLMRQLRRGIVLWQSSDPGTSQSITLKIAERTVIEGDLLLEHHLDGLSLHKLSFTFVPGRILNKACPQVLFIGGSQGLHSSAEQVRHAAKANGEITPANMLIIAMRGLALALGIDQICGVRAHSQPVVHDKPKASVSVYDDLWLMNGGMCKPNYYVMPVDTSHDLTKDIEGKNRSRTRRKRRLRQSLTETIAGHVRTILASS